MYLTYIEDKPKSPHLMILRYFILRYNQRDGMGSGYPRSLVQHAIRVLSANGCASTYNQRSFGCRIRISNHNPQTNFHKK
jgi:hypothetical protein